MPIHELIEFGIQIFIIITIIIFINKIVADIQPNSIN